MWQCVIVPNFLFRFRSTFFLAWGLCPIQMEYHNSGHFYFKAKVTAVCMYSSSFFFFFHPSSFFILSCLMLVND
jgi:hypothetical protein